MIREDIRQKISQFRFKERHDAEIKTIEISPLIKIDQDEDDDFPYILLLIPACIGIGSVIYYKKDFIFGIKKL